MDERRDRPNLKDEDVGLLRRRDAGAASAGPEANATMRRVWSEPGGEAHAYRNATAGAGGEAEGHDELTAAETPEATRRLATGEPADDHEPTDAQDKLGQRE